MEQAMTDIVTQLIAHAGKDDLLGSAAVMLQAAEEIEQMRERVNELKPYEVVSGDTWKARIAYEELEAAGRMIKLLEVERDKLNGRIKGLQAKVKAFETSPSPPDIPSTETQSSPELEGVSG